MKNIHMMPLNNYNTITYNKDEQHTYDEVPDLIDKP